jgi:hypothetical protein
VKEITVTTVSGEGVERMETPGGSKQVTLRTGQTVAFTTK